MALCNIKGWLLKAQHEGWAVGAFNANTMEQVQAIAQAATEEKAPAIIQVSRRALVYVGNGNVVVGLRYMAAIAILAAQQADAPVALHLDHAPEDLVLQAMAAGFTSVMFDGGDLPFGENIERTIRLREKANDLDICMEAELGEVPRAGMPGADSAADAMTDPEEAAEFVRVTGVDSLAIAVGSVHAIKQKNVELNLQRLKEIRSRVTVPLVLHGSSGVKDEHIQAGIALGLCKVNVATQLNQAYTLGIQDCFLANAHESDPRNYLGAGRETMKELVRERMRSFRASGKAS